jgi:hypothetical protein
VPAPEVNCAIYTKDARVVRIPTSNRHIDMSIALAMRQRIVMTL